MTESIFCYPLGAYRILIESGIRSELITTTQVYPIPFTPTWCAGLTSVRGDLCIVLDMHRILLNGSLPPKTYFLWFKPEHYKEVVIGCDGLPTTIDYPSDDLAIDTPSTLPSWVQHVWQDEVGLILQVNHVRLFSLLCNQKR
ncbi:hypothetical protein [Thiolinea disciformis]|uniref:hypothetical protein n=1 Tax=Thiolinea disciformis TaxID=125614 RepID=UPI000380D545|nr:hypothetical protein [Thiolinea disciformis]